MPRFDRFVGERVLVWLQLPSGAQQFLRCQIIFVFSTPNNFDLLTLYSDQGLQFALFDTPDIVFDEGDLELLISGNNPDEFQAAADASGVSLHTGDAGEVVIEGFGLGALGLVPGVRTVFANQFIAGGMVLAGITGDGFNRFRIHWEIPGDTIPGSYQDPAFIAIPIALIAGFILRALFLLAISAAIWKAPAIFMSIKGTPATPAKPSMPVRNGQTGPVGRVMVRKSDASFVPPNADGTSTCDDPQDCIIVGEPGTEGTKGILGDLKPLIWGAGILVGGLVVVQLLNAIPRRSGNGR